MAEQESGQWNVAAKENRVYLERANDDGELLFGDSLEPHEARQLARALTKFADKLDESPRSDDSEEPADDGASDSDDADDAEDTDDKSDESDDAEDTSDNSDDSDDAEDTEKSSD
ncbi:hypothetical protein [Mycolicibacterium sp. GF69]|uniref:hypothetical protein n=1 Tax=Mycolicibacterium sp. GF69 TaxID=2267251 RepID=UPI0014040349|nr:hypothetical protein [Mycolicibacterium sp. GF69]